MSSRKNAAVSLSQYKYFLRLLVLLRIIGPPLAATDQEPMTFTNIYRFVKSILFVSTPVLFFIITSSCLTSALLLIPLIVSLSKLVYLWDSLLRQY
jgi:hypothetical protein